MFFHNDNIFRTFIFVYWILVVFRIEPVKCLLGLPHQRKLFQRAFNRYLDLEPRIVQFPHVGIIPKTGIAILRFFTKSKTVEQVPHSSTFSSTNPELFLKCNVGAQNTPKLPLKRFLA